MNILILGNGGREHALGWKLSQSKGVGNIYFSPGNSGTRYIGNNIPIDLSDPEKIVQVTKNLKIELVVIGPFRYLNGRIVDVLQNAGIKVFGPCQKASKIEGSKFFSKQLMKGLNIPTTKFELFRDIDTALEFVKATTFPIVIKTDIPIVGLGVEIVYDQKSASSFLKKVFGGRLGNYGAGVVIEEFVEGVEVSAHAFCDGKNAIMMPFTQDHKRLLDGDLGVNTAGIGAITPVPTIPSWQLEEIREKVVLPILDRLYKDGVVFCGVMYPGIIFTKNGWMVLEINARFGDPEAQNYMVLLKNDLLEIMLACVHGTLNNCEVTWSKDYVCNVVLTVKGYPDHMITYTPIFGLPKHACSQSPLIVFHNETKNILGWPFTYGHRVATLTCTAHTLEQAISFVYQCTKNIWYFGKYMRSDIGKKCLTTKQ